jgi:hypothetical protein
MRCKGSDGKMTRWQGGSDGRVDDQGLFLSYYILDVVHLYVSAFAFPFNLRR